MANPKINLEKTKLDLALEWTGWTFVLLAWFFIIRGHMQLPDIIPLHFDARGHADNYGSKNNLFILPAIGSILYIGILILSRYPEKFNYISKITPENATGQYRTATRVLRITNWIAMAGICYLCYAISRSADIRNNEPAPWFFILFFTGLNLPVIIMLIRNFLKLN